MHIPMRSHHGRWLLPQQLHVAILHTSRNTMCHTRSEQPAFRWDFTIYSSLLKRCDSLKTLPDGKCIHDQIVRNGLDQYIPLNNLLLQMYGKCEALPMACGLFARMCQRDLFSWNFMIRAYTRHGQCKDAFLLFRRMQEEGLIPNKNIFSSLLSAYVGQAALSEGQQVHAQIASSGCQDDVFVGTALISMYGKCGCVEDARKLFVHMPERDIISWNTMIAIYNEHGLTEDALELYNRMPWEGRMPTNVTFISILDACNSNEGRWIHVHILSSEYKEDIIVGTALMNMYGKCGILDDAQRIFDGSHERDRVLWNAIVAAHVQNGESKAALQLFHRMWQEGLHSDLFTFSSTLSACGDEGDVREGKRVHALLSACGFDLETIVGNALVNMYGKCASVEDSWRTFCEIPYRDTVSWNVVIVAYARHGKANHAFQIFEQMQQEGVIPNDITLVSMFEMCGGSQAAQAQGERLHARIYGSGFESDTAVGNALVSMYGNWGRLKDARRVLDELPKRDKATFINFLTACTSKAVLTEGQEIHALVVTIGLEFDLAMGTAILTMYGKCASLNDAWRLFDKITQQDVVSWTAMISVCTYNGQPKDALHLFEEMQLEGFKADKITLVSILDACVSQAALAEGRRMHRHIMVGAFESDIVVGTALLNMYGKCGILEDARRVFDNLLQRDAITWTVIIATYAQHGHAKESLRLFDKMRQGGVAPNEITFVSVLIACSHSGLVDEGRHWFRSMKTTYGITPGVDHYNCMIDLLARAGLVEEAEALINEMPLSPSSVTWATLLGACRDRFDAQRGERVAENVFELDAVNASPYVMLSNIYTGACTGNDAVTTWQSST